MGFCYSRNDYKSLLVSSYVTMCVPLHIPKSEVPKRLVKASGRFGTSLFGIRQVLALYVGQWGSIRQTKAAGHSSLCELSHSQPRESEYLNWFDFSALVLTCASLYLEHGETESCS